MLKKYFPLYLSLENKNILFVGGGSVAERKLKNILDNGSDTSKITLVSKSVSLPIKLMSSKFGFEIHERAFKMSDLNNTQIVFVATSDTTLNEKICARCLEKHILVNCANPGKSGDFIVPATYNNGSISISVSSYGRSSYISKILKDELRDTAGKYAKLIDILEPIKSALLTHKGNSEYNKKLSSSLSENQLRSLVKENKFAKIKNLVKEMLEEIKI